MDSLPHTETTSARESSGCLPKIKIYSCFIRSKESIGEFGKSHKSELKMRLVKRAKVGQTAQPLPPALPKISPCAKIFKYSFDHYILNLWFLFTEKPVEFLKTPALNIIASYELLYITPSRVKEPDQTRSLILNILKEKGAETWVGKDFGKRRRAYAIDHVRNGQYIGIEFQAEGPVLSELKNALNVFDDILRFQIVKISALSDKNNIKTDMLRIEMTQSAEPMPSYARTAPPAIVLQKQEALAPRHQEPQELKVVEEKIVPATPVAAPSAPEEVVKEEAPKEPEAPKVKKDPKIALEDLDKK